MLLEFYSLTVLDFLRSQKYGKRKSLLKTAVDIRKN